MSSWEKVTLGDICDLVAGFAFKSGEFGDDFNNKVVKIKDIQPPYINLRNCNKVDNSRYDQNRLSKFKVRKGDYLLAMTGATIGKIGIIVDDDEAYINQRVLLFRPREELCNKMYLYFALLCSSFESYIYNFVDSDTAQPNISSGTIGKFELTLPPLEEQERIAKILGSLDDKIELNNKINRNLEAQAEALFKQWFVDFDFPDQSGNPYRTSGGAMIDSPMGKIPVDWRVDSLTEIANYLNGLAMQKFRPLDGEVGIPVLKIKELGQKECNASSDLCSPSIKGEYLINNGDVVFSWSGTLMIDIWCGGLCGLNQHLFKVTSETYPKWLYYMWTNEHLQEFIRIAKDKAVTMGHIKREHLVKSQVLIPEEKTLSLMTNIISPMFDEMINRRVESRKLARLRDTLLQKLMNKEI